MAQGEDGRGHGGDLGWRAWWTEVCRGWLWSELGRVRGVGGVLRSDRIGTVTVTTAAKSRRWITELPDRLSIQSILSQ